MALKIEGSSPFTHPIFPRAGAWHTPDIGMSPSGKAPDFDSGIRRFESCHPSQNRRGHDSARGGVSSERTASRPPHDPLAQQAEQLPFKQWVWSSNLQRVTTTGKRLMTFAGFLTF